MNKVTAAVLAAAMVGSMAMPVFADDITGTSAKNTEGTTTVKYTVTEGYTWSVPASIDFGKDAGINKTVEKSVVGTTTEASKVAVTKNNIPDGKKLQITDLGL